MQSSTYTQKVTRPYRPGRAVGKKKKPNPINSPWMLIFFLLMFDLEFTFICSKAARSPCNGCLRHCKPQHQVVQEGFYLWLKMNTRRSHFLAHTSCLVPEWDLGVGAAWRSSHFCVCPGVAPPIFRFDLSINKGDCVPCAVRLVVKELVLFSFPHDPRLWSEENNFLSSSVLDWKWDHKQNKSSTYNCCLLDFLARRFQFSYSGKKKNGTDLSGMVE